MNNLYFLESDNNSLINFKIKEILKKLGKDDNIITFDMQEVNIKDAIICLDTYSLWQEEKIVHVKNASFLGTGTSDINHDIDMLSKYLKNPNSNNILFISCPKLDGKKKIVKEIKDTCSFIDVSYDIKEYIKNKCNGYNISFDTINYFIQIVGDDYNRVNNELDKLLNLSFDNKNITKEDIDVVCIKNSDLNIFNLIDAIINKDKKKSLEIYENMINYGEDTFKILIALANQIRLLYQVKILSKKSNDEITDILKLKNPKQVVALRFKINKYNAKDLLNYLYHLSIIDEELKTGKIIDTVAFPCFIAGL